MKIFLCSAAVIATAILGAYSFPADSESNNNKAPIPNKENKIFGWDLGLGLLFGKPSVSLNLATTEDKNITFEAGPLVSNTNTNNGWGSSGSNDGWSAPPPPPTTQPPSGWGWAPPPPEATGGWRQEKGDQSEAAASASAPSSSSSENNASPQAAAAIEEPAPVVVKTNEAVQSQHIYPVKQDDIPDHDGAAVASVDAASVNKNSDVKVSVPLKTAKDKGVVSKRV